MMEKLVRAHVLRRWGMCSRDGMCCATHRNAYWPSDASDCTLLTDRLDDAEMLALDVKLLLGILRNEGVLELEHRWGVRWMDRGRERTAWFAVKERAMSFARDLDTVMDIVVEEHLATPWKSVE